MIGSLTGKIISFNNNELLLNVNDVGYIIYCANLNISSKLEKNIILTLYIETIVREDSITLYGFSDLEDKKWFRNLMSVQGIGAKLAITVLSYFNSKELNSAIVNENKNAIKGIPGVGNKVAERMVRELKDKINRLDTELPYNETSSKNNFQGEALIALMKLGYSNTEALNAIKISENIKDSKNTTELIKNSLKNLGK